MLECEGKVSGVHAEQRVNLAPFAEDKDTVPVYLRSDEEVPYGVVLKVMAAVEQMGFENLSLVADQPENEG